MEQQQHDIHEDKNCLKRHMSLELEVEQEYVAGTELQDQSTEIYNCVKCDYTSRNKNYLKQHVSLVHVAERPFKCPLCDYAGKRSHSLREHLLVHSSHRPYACSYCNASFRKKAHLTNHMRLHSSEQVNACKLCNQFIGNQNDLSKHLREYHKDDEIFRCEFCDFASDEDDKLVSHLCKHSTAKAYQCKECGFTTMLLNDMKQHLADEKHGDGENSFCLNVSDMKNLPEVMMKCSECGFVTNSKDTLRNHMWVHVIQPVPSKSPSQATSNQLVMTQSPNVGSKRNLVLNPGMELVGQPRVALPVSAKSTVIHVASVPTRKPITLSKPSVTDDGLVFLKGSDTKLEIMEGINTKIAPIIIEKEQDSVIHESTNKSQCNLVKVLPVTTSAMMQNVNSPQIQVMAIENISGDKLNNSSPPDDLPKQKSLGGKTTTIVNQGSDGKYNCSQCTFASAQAFEFIRHMLSHKPQTSACTTVNMNSSSVISTKESVAPEAAAPYKLVMGETVSKKGKKGAKKRAPGTKDMGLYKCCICGYTCENQRTIKAHVWRHSGHKDIDYPMFQNGPLSVHDTFHSGASMSVPTEKSDQTASVEPPSTSGGAQDHALIIIKDVSKSSVSVHDTYISSVVTNPVPTIETVKSIEMKSDDESITGDNSTVKKETLDVQNLQIENTEVVAMAEQDLEIQPPSKKMKMINEDTKPDPTSSELYNTPAAIEEMVVEDENMTTMQGVVVQEMSNLYASREVSEQDLLGTPSPARYVCSPVSRQTSRDEAPGSTTMSSPSETEEMQETEDGDECEEAPLIINMDENEQVYAVGGQTVVMDVGDGEQCEVVLDGEVYEVVVESTREDEVETEEGEEISFVHEESESDDEELELSRGNQSIVDASTIKQLLQRERQKPPQEDGQQEVIDGSQRKEGGISSSLLAVIEHVRQRHASTSSQNAGDYEKDDLEYSLSKDPNVKLNAGEHSTKMKCLLCYYTTSNVYSMTAHMKTHKTRKPTECSLCDFVAASSAELQQHIFQHCKMRTFPCKLCSKVFHYKSELRAHNAAHNHESGGLKPVAINKYECSMCTFDTVSFSEYSNHLCDVHSNETPHRLCAQCGELILKPEKTSKGKQTKSKMQSMCHNCLKKTSGEPANDTKGATSKSPKTRRGHNRGYQCAQCKFVSRNYNDMRGHLRSHIEGRDLTCGMCKFVATSLRSLKSHMKRHANDQRFVELPLEQYKCNLCGYVCHHLPALKSHMWKHASHTGFNYHSTNDLLNSDEPHYEGPLLQPKQPLHSTINIAEDNASTSVTFRCCHCGYETADRAELNTHAASVHYEIVQKTMEVNKDQIEVMTSHMHTIS